VGDSVTVTVSLPAPYVDALDELVRRGVYRSRSEAIREAIRELLKREFPDLYQELVGGEG